MGDPRIAAIPVEEDSAPLVDLRDVRGFMFSDLLADRSDSYTKVRADLARRLQDARRALPTGLELMIVEGHRAITLQEHYFSKYLDSIENANPDLSAEEAHQLASRYVAPPDIAPHVSGAAVDLTLTTTDGEKLDLGTPVNATPEESDGGCYFHASNITAAARQLRSILADVMESAGLVNYPTEWWHWSYGDRYWAFITGASAAKFGPASDG
jgi:zinc D-Ala-D-Ala dipeptidase